MEAELSPLLPESRGQLRVNWHVPVHLRRHPTLRHPQSAACLGHGQPPEFLHRYIEKVGEPSAAGVVIGPTEDAEGDPPPNLSKRGDPPGAFDEGASIEEDPANRLRYAAGSKVEP